MNRAALLPLRAMTLVAAVLGAGCNLTYDPDAVPFPCVPSCSGVACGEDDGCGEPCAASGPTPGCIFGLHQVKKPTLSVAAGEQRTADGHAVRAARVGAAHSTQSEGGHAVRGAVHP